MKATAKILIVDDDRDYLDATRRILENASYTVETASNSTEAMDKLKEGIPDLIILDMMMQRGAEGYTLSRKFKKEVELADTPIIIATSITEQTGYKFTGDPRHPELFPVNAIMEKPLATNELLSKIEELLSKKEG